MDLSITILCPLCGANAPSASRFCPMCGKSMRCQNLECNAPLVANAKFCFQCGQPITDGASQVQPNRYSRDVEGKNHKEHTEFSISDNAVNALAPLIVEQIFARQSQHNQNAPRNHNKSMAPPALTGDLFDNEQPIIDSSFSEPGLQQNHPESGAARFFEKNGDFLIPRTRDFKGKNWAEQSRHYLVLYIAAYNSLFGKPVPDKNHFKPAADKAEIYDPGNFSKYVDQQISSYTMLLDGGYRLNDDGDKELVRIIALMDSPGTEAGYEYWKRETGNGTERHRLSNKDKERLDKWAAEEADLGKLDVRNIKSSLHYALLAFWILTVKLNKVKSIHRNEAYCYLCKRYEIVAITSQAFSRAVLDDKLDLFRQSGDNHFLSTDAITLVEGWTEGKPIEVPKPDKKERKK